MQPRYQALKDYIKEGILQERWPRGSRVPSENELAREFNVSRMTANRALKELTHEGTLIRKQGLGTFIAESRPLTSVLEIKNIADEIFHRDQDYSNDIIELAKIKATPEVAMHMHCEKGDDIFYSLIVHKENDKPVQLEERFVNPLQAPDYLRQNFRIITPNKYLSSVAPMSRAEQIIEAVNIDIYDATPLGIQQGDPGLVIHRTTWSLENLVTYARLLHPGNNYRLASEITYA